MMMMMMSRRQRTMIFKLCSWNISSREILINQQYHRLSWRFHCDWLCNPHRQLSPRWLHSIRHDGSADGHLADQSSFRVHYSRDDWVRTFELATCPRERFLKRNRWHRHIDMPTVHRSSSVKLAIWMTIGSSRGWRSPTNAASPLISVLRCWNS